MAKSTKTKALTELIKLIRLEQMQKWPNVPFHILPKPNVFDTANPERKQLKRICRYIELKGGVAKVTNSSAKRIDNRTSYVDGVGFYRVIGSVEYRKSDIEVGTSDITATIKGRSYGIELKRVYASGAKDRQSEVQKKWQEKFEASGGIYIIVSSFDDFFDNYQHIL